ncbi:hypothetical protein AVEN_251243-1 [Araneus ventricosus]|uniref:Uncharacterized protein n=1 Tax=Araneus ventricosus TaxID=182803 RepID=A0A4Y2LJS0_ARAVE|nr:hypothetical protein AVEN_251243-1 [Araneus ventricosus]
MICSSEQSKRGALYAIPSLFTFCAKQPPEIAAMAKITLLHPVAYEKAKYAFIGADVLGMKIRNRHVESRLQKSLTELHILNVCLGFN